MKKVVGIRLVLVALTMVFFGASSYAQSIVGKWKTVDDETGKTKSVVQIWKAKDGLYYGKIIKLYDAADKDSKCSNCDKSDPRYNKKVLGMKIITKMKKTDDNEWTEGKILDPNNGKVYKCKIFREDANLMVRGYIGFFFRTQKWLPYK